MKVSIIIPYQHLPERLQLFKRCIDNLLSMLPDNFELCVHEVGTSRHLNLDNSVKYRFTRFNGVFHRAWAINRGVRQLASGDNLVLMDGDLIVPEGWFDEVSKCSKPSVAWGKLHNLTEHGTARYIKTGQIDGNSINKVKVPSMGSAAGGATLIPSKLFHSIKGIPEDFFGSWGGEDNAFWAKLKKLGYGVGRFRSSIFHLYHEPTTPRVREVQDKVFKMLHWNKKQWEVYIDLIGDKWGEKTPDVTAIPSQGFVSSSRRSFP